MIKLIKRLMNEYGLTYLYDFSNLVCLVLLCICAIALIFGFFGTVIWLGMKFL